jgi:hypothetical protein
VQNWIFLYGDFSHNKFNFYRGEKVMNKKSLQKAGFTLYKGFIIDNVEIVKYFTKTHIMRISQEHPSHHSYETHITRPEEDVLLSHALEDEFTGPIIHRHELLISQADINLEVATQIEEAYGLDAAGSFYEKAMQDYLGALFIRGAYATEPDYTFYLKLGGVQARLANWEGLRSYQTVATPEQQNQLELKDKVKITHRPFKYIEGIVRGEDRRKDLFQAAVDCYEEAFNSILANAGGDIERLPPEALARIFSENCSTLALKADFERAHGDKIAATADIMQARASIADAKEVIEHTSTHEIDPSLAYRILEQDNTVRDVYEGKTDTSELKRISVEALHELAVA